MKLRAGADDVFRPVAWESAHLDILCRTIAPGGRLAPWLWKFPHGVDRRLWRKIAVRKL